MSNCHLLEAYKRLTNITAGKNIIERQSINQSEKILILDLQMNQCDPICKNENYLNENYSGAPLEGTRY